MFDLEKAVRKWRRGLEHGSSLSARELDELEDHLRARAELESHLNPGLRPATAFATARAELGEPAAVSREFAKAGKPRWRRLLVAGWALFGVSFLLPTFFMSGPGLELFSRPFATEPYFGYEVFWRLLSEGGEFANVLAALMPNLLLVFTLPALLGRSGRHRRGLRWALTTVGLVTLALAFQAPRIEMRGNGWEPVFADLGIGFWVWSLSFVCAASALWLRDRGRVAAKAAESTA